MWRVADLKMGVRRTTALRAVFAVGLPESCVAVAASPDVATLLSSAGLGSAVHSFHHSGTRSSSQSIRTARSLHFQPTPPPRRNTICAAPPIDRRQQAHTTTHAANQNSEIYLTALSSRRPQKPCAAVSEGEGQRTSAAPRTRPITGPCPPDESVTIIHHHSRYQRHHHQHLLTSITRGTPSV